MLLTTNNGVDDANGSVVIVRKANNRFDASFPSGWNEDSVDKQAWQRTWKTMTKLSQKGEMTTGKLLITCLISMCTCFVPCCLAMNRARSRIPSLRHEARWHNLTQGLSSGYLLKFKLAKPGDPISVEHFEARLIRNPQIKNMDPYDHSKHVPTKHEFMLLKWYFEKRDGVYQAVRHLRISEMRGKQVQKEYIGDGIRATRRYTWVDLDKVPSELIEFTVENYLFFYAQKLLPNTSGHIKNAYLEYIETALSFYGDTAPTYWLDLDYLGRSRFSKPEQLLEQLSKIDMDNSSVKSRVDSILSEDDLTDIFNGLLDTYDSKKGSESNHKNCAKYLKNLSLKEGSQKGFLVTLVARTFGKGPDGSKSPNFARFPRKWTLQICFWKPTKNPYFHILRSTLDELPSKEDSSGKKTKKKKNRKKKKDKDDNDTEKLVDDDDFANCDVLLSDEKEGRFDKFITSLYK